MSLPFLRIRLRKSDGTERVVVGARTFGTGETSEILSQAWPSPDGSRVLFNRFDGKDSAIWIVPITGGAPVRVDVQEPLGGTP